MWRPTGCAPLVPAMLFLELALRRVTVATVLWDPTVDHIRRQIVPQPRVLLRLVPIHAIGHIKKLPCRHNLPPRQIAPCRVLEHPGKAIAFARFLSGELKDDGKREPDQLVCFLKCGFFLTVWRAGFGTAVLCAGWGSPESDDLNRASQHFCHVSSERPGPFLGIVLVTELILKMHVTGVVPPFCGTIFIEGIIKRDSVDCVAKMILRLLGNSARTYSVQQA